MSLRIPKKALLGTAGSGKVLPTTLVHATSFQPFQPMLLYNGGLKRQGSRKTVTHLNVRPLLPSTAVTWRQSLSFVPRPPFLFRTHKCCSTARAYLLPTIVLLARTHFYDEVASTDRPSPGLRRPATATTPVFYAIQRPRRMGKMDLDLRGRWGRGGAGGESTRACCLTETTFLHQARQPVQAQGTSHGEWCEQSL